MDTNCAVQSEKTALNREFEHGSIAEHKENARANLWAAWGCDIAYDIVYDRQLALMNFSIEAGILLRGI